MARHLGQALGETGPLVGHPEEIVLFMRLEVVRVPEDLPAFFQFLFCLVKLLLQLPDPAEPQHGSDSFLYLYDCTTNWSVLFPLYSFHSG